MFKPEQTHWFETYTPRNQTVYAIEALAQTGSVELTHQLWSARPQDRALLQARLHEFNLLAERFRGDLPGRLLPPRILDESPEQICDEALKTLRSWSAGLLRLRRQLHRLAAQIAELSELRALLEAIPDHDLDFAWIQHSSRVLYKKLWSCPAGVFSHPAGKDIAIEVFAGPKRDFVLALGTPEHVGVVEAATTLAGCREIIVPAWLTQSSHHSLGEIDQRLGQLEQQRGETADRLARHHQDEQLRQALAAARLLSWYLENSNASSHDKEVCHIVGWTSAQSPAELQGYLKRSGIQASVSFPDPVIAARPPVRSRQPWFIQPFGIFVSLLGTPGRNEIDPTPLLALIVPLLFGYMFPDIGHGAILLIAGLIMRRRVAAARILVPCGLAAIGFGLLFGDLFGQHDLIEPLWLRPLENPLLVLILPLLLGALLIITGLVFSAIEAHWRGELQNWLHTEAAVMMLYLVLIAGTLRIELLWLLAPVLAWVVLGTARVCQSRMRSCLASMTGHLLDSLYRLVLSSISFVRVGAFALAHSGSSHAANLITDMIDNPLLAVLVFVVSHTLIIVLEGLIVFVQTTRLIVFEFFIRFLRAEGRVFRPLRGP